MDNDLLNHIDDTEYNIAYDRIYDDNTKIIGKNNMRDTRIVSNEMTENGMCECICGFYQHSRNFFILLFFVIVFLGGILFLISRV